MFHCWEKVVLVRGSVDFLLNVVILVVTSFIFESPVHRITYQTGDWSIGKTSAVPHYNVYSLLLDFLTCMFVTFLSICMKKFAKTDGNVECFTILPLMCVSVVELLHV